MRTRRDSSIDPNMENVRAAMVREHLDDIPIHPLPAGYSMRFYRRGDKKTWVRIHRQAEPLIDVTAKRFDREFSHDLPSLPKRCHFLVAPDGSDVGTITSWYRPRYHHRPWGQIHWVAIGPEHRGKGLSRSIMTVAMLRLKQLHHRRAMLLTNSPRLAAIKTYLHFGFAPDMHDPDAAKAWALVAKALPHPKLKAYR